MRGVSAGALSAGLVLLLTGCASQRTEPSVHRSAWSAPHARASDAEREVPRVVLPAPRPSAATRCPPWRAPDSPEPLDVEANQLLSWETRPGALCEAFERRAHEPVEDELEALARAQRELDAATKRAIAFNRAMEAEADVKRTGRDLARRAWTDAARSMSRELVDLARAVAEHEERIQEVQCLSRPHVDELRRCRELAQRRVTERLALAATRPVDEILAIPVDQRLAAENDRLQEEGRRLWQEELARRRARERRNPRQPSWVSVSTRGGGSSETGTRFRCAGSRTGVVCTPTRTEHRSEIVLDPTRGLCGELQDERAGLRGRASQLTQSWTPLPATDSARYHELLEIYGRLELLEHEIVACREDAWAQYETALRASGDPCAEWTRRVHENWVASSAEARTSAQQLERCRAVDSLRRP